MGKSRGNDDSLDDEIIEDITDHAKQLLTKGLALLEDIGEELTQRYSAKTLNDISRYPRLVVEDIWSNEVVFSNIKDQRIDHFFTHLVNVTQFNEGEKVLLERYLRLASQQDGYLAAGQSGVFFGLSMKYVERKLDINVDDSTVEIRYQMINNNELKITETFSYRPEFNIDNKSFITKDNQPALKVCCESHIQFSETEYGLPQIEHVLDNIEVDANPGLVEALGGSKNRFTRKNFQRRH